MLSQTTEYALRAAVCLASESPEPQSTAAIARRTRVPAPYLSKVLQGLSRAGIVRSQRGLHGGFSLARDPKDVRILEVVNAVEPIERITRCPLDLPGHGERLCGLHRRLDRALATVEDAFHRTTLAEVLRDRDGSQPLCPVPDPRARSRRRTR